MLQHSNETELLVSNLLTHSRRNADILFIVTCIHRFILWIKKTQAMGERCLISPTVIRKQIITVQMLKIIIGKPHGYNKPFLFIKRHTLTLIGIRGNNLFTYRF